MAATRAASSVVPSSTPRSTDRNAAAQGPDASSLSFFVGGAPGFDAAAVLAGAGGATAPFGAGGGGGAGGGAPAFVPASPSTSSPNRSSRKSPPPAPPSFAVGCLGGVGACGGRAEPPGGVPPRS